MKPHVDIDWRFAMPISNPDDGSTWQDVVGKVFGGGKNPPPEQPPLDKPVYELTERERGFLRIDCRTWVDPMKFMVYKNAVIRYVTTHRSGFDYSLCYGLYDDPYSALEAILNSNEYREYRGWNAKMPSVTPLVNAAIQAGAYTFPQSDYVNSECEAAIAYYHKTGGTNYS